MHDSEAIRKRLEFIGVAARKLIDAAKDAQKAADTTNSQLVFVQRVLSGEEYDVCPFCKLPIFGDEKQIAECHKGCYEKAKREWTELGITEDEYRSKTGKIGQRKSRGRPKKANPANQPPASDKAKQAASADVTAAEKSKTGRPKP